MPGLFLFTLVTSINLPLLDNEGCEPEGANRYRGPVEGGAGPVVGV